MPLIKSGSREAISTNIREMIHAGHPRKQAIAAALSTARRYGKQSGGEVEPDPFESAPHTSEGIPQITVSKAAPPAEKEQQPITPMMPPPENPAVYPGLGQTALDIGKSAVMAFPEAAQTAYRMGTGKVAPEDIPMELTGAMLGVMGPPGAKAEAKVVEKAAPLAKSLAEGFLNTSNFKLVGPQKGTMPGGFMSDPKTGMQWYVKKAPNHDQAKNEMLAAQLYKLAGVPVADVKMTTIGDGSGIASSKLYGLQLSAVDPEKYTQVNHLHENFPIDAWLANWDAVGTGPENPLGNIIVGPGNIAHRIDTGGALRYSGTGGLKKLTPAVLELQTMRDPNINPLSAKVFGNIDESVARVGAQRLANVDDKKIAKLVTMYGPQDDKEKQQLLNTLLIRKHDIASSYGVKPQVSATKDPATVALEKAGISQLLPSQEKPLKLMQLNKTHSNDQLINTLKNYHWDEIPEQSVTEKQKSKIGALLDAIPTKQLHEMLQGIEPQEAINVKSWIGDASKNQLKAYSKGKEFGPPLTPASLDDSHTVDQVVNALSKVYSNSGSVSYATHNKGKEIIDQFKPEDILNAIGDMPLSQQHKVMSWLSSQKKGEVNDLTISGWQKAHGKSIMDKFREHFSQLEPFDFREWKAIKPKGFQDEANMPKPDYAKAEELHEKGFNPNVYAFHGGMKHYPEELQDPKTYKAGQHLPEEAFFAAPKYSSALVYAGHNPSAVKPYFVRSPKTYEVDWERLTGDSFYSSEYMRKIIKAGQENDADLIILKNMGDIEGHSSTQFVFLKTNALRAPHAKFNPAHFDKAWPLAGVAGGATFVLKDRGNKDSESKMNRGGVPSDKFARGGTPHYGGMIKSAIPGRTDKIPLNVPAGSYILPADIPSALGQGNTEAGSQILTKMFKAGPYGSGMTGGIKPARPYVPRWNWMHYPRPPIPGRAYLPRSRGYAEGGETDDHVPIIAAGGEYVIPPETVKEIGHGNIDAGHKVLDKFVLSVRKKHIETLKKLKPPKT